MRIRLLMLGLMLSGFGLGLDASEVPPVEEGSPRAGAFENELANFIYDNLRDSVRCTDEVFGQFLAELEKRAYSQVINLNLDCVKLEKRPFSDQFKPVSFMEFIRSGFGADAIDPKDKNKQFVAGQNRVAGIIDEKQRALRAAKGLRKEYHFMTAEELTEAIKDKRLAVREESDIGPDSQDFSYKARQVFYRFTKGKLVRLAVSAVMLFCIIGIPIIVTKIVTKVRAQKKRKLQTVEQ